MTKITRALCYFRSCLMDFVYPPDADGNKYQAQDGTRFKTREELREYEG